MPANGLRVNHYHFVAFHSMWIIFLKGICVLERVEIIHKSKLPFRKIIPISRHYHLKYTLITLASVSYLRSLVVRAVHQHRTGVGTIPAGGPYS